MTAEEFIALPLKTQRRLLKRQVYDTVPEGEVKETAFAIKEEAYDVYRWRDENNERYNLLDPRLVAIMHQRQDLRVLRFQADLFDCILFRRPTGLSSFSEINQQVTTVLKEVTEAVQAVLSSVAPGSAGGATITAREMEAIDKEADEGMAALAALKAAARMVYEGKG